MKEKSSEGRIKCIINTQGSNTFIAQYFINGGLYYIHQRKYYREK